MGNKRLNAQNRPVSVFFRGLGCVVFRRAETLEFQSGANEIGPIVSQGKAKTTENSDFPSLIWFFLKKTPEDGIFGVADLVYR